MPTRDYDVQQTLHLYDHYVDNGEWERLQSLLTDDFTLIGPGGEFNGPGAAKEYEQQAGEHLPAHHVINTLVEETGDPDTVRAWSRYLLVTWDYAARSGDYLDLLRLTSDGWRIARRQVLPRGAGGYQRPEHGSFAAWRQVGV